MYEVLLELDDLLETLTYWLSFAAVALSVIVVAAYVWHKAAEQKATRAEPRKRKDGMTYWEDEDFSIGQDGMFYDNKYTEDGQE